MASVQTPLVASERMFGVLADEPLPKERLEEVLPTWGETELASWLDEVGDNVKCRARSLLSTTYHLPVKSQHSTRSALAAMLLRRDLPQDEVMFFMWRAMTDSDFPSDLLSAACEARPDLLQLHFDCAHRRNLRSSGEIRGFPASCVVQSHISDPDMCIKVLDIITSHGADVNARYLHKEEETAIHFAARKGELKIVEYLLNKDANIDVDIDGITAREIIKLLSLDLVNNYPVAKPCPCDVSMKLFSALYDDDEDEFLALLRINAAKIDVDQHDGRYTLLQLAVDNKLEKAATHLIDKGADINKMAGFSTEPVLIAINNPEFEVIRLFALNRRKLDLRFSVDSGTFLNALALECTDRTIGIDDNRTSFYGLIEEAINQKIHISALDRFGCTALEVLGFQAHNNATLFHLLLSEGGFLTICENLVLNTRPEIFTEFFDQHIGFVEEYKRGQSAFPWANRSEIIEVKYGFLEPLESNKTKRIVPEMLPFYEICKSKEHQKILLHPIVTLFLVYKWRKIAFIYIFNFLLYFTFTMLYSVYVYRSVNKPSWSAATNQTAANSTASDADTEQARTGVHVWAFSIFFWCILFLRELFQICISYRQYFKNFENYLEIILLFTSFLTFFPYFSETKYTAAIAIALTYIELTLLIGRHPYTGTYITMFVTVSFKSIELILIFSSFIFAFAFGFYVFFHNFNEKNFFNNIWNSILKTSVMAAGEFNIDDLRFDVSPGASEIMFALFLIFVPIVLMNLLNALAVSDTQRVIDETSLLCCVANIKHYTKIESMWLGYSSDNPGERCYGFPPSKQTNVLSKFISILRYYFRVNVLPFPQNPYQNPGPTSILRIHLDQKYYYPHVYLFYKAPSATSSSYQVLRKPRTLYQYLKFIYFRIILRGNEDKTVLQLRLRKYPSLERDVTESIASMGRNLNEAFDSCNVEQRETIVAAIDSLKENQITALCEIEQTIKTKLTNQNFLNMERVLKNFKDQDLCLKELLRVQKKQEIEMKKIVSELSEVKHSLGVMSGDVKIIKDLLTAKSK